jgi:outer membrane murein-binding lipoprotein Lpp
MKPTSQAIQTWINNPSIQKQMETMFTTSANFSAHETSISEAKEQFDFVIEHLTNFIEKEELDNLTFHKRNGINGMLNNISAQLNQAQRYNYNLAQVPNVGNAIFSYILSLRDQLDIILFYTKGKGAADYLNESKELIKIRKRYSKLISDIEQVEKEKDKIIKSNSELLEKITEIQKTVATLQQNSSTVTNLNTQIQKLYNQIKANAEDIEAKKVTINSLHKTAKELEDIFENANSEVKALSDNSSKSLKKFIDEKTEFVDGKVTEFSTRTGDLVSKNESLQEKINTLLEGANAGELYKAFNTRKKDIEETLNKWFWGIVIINVFLVFFTLLIINGSEYLGIKALSATTMDAAFYLKLFISIPLLFLDWFIIRQYNQRKDLAEKYAFKSVLSLSLLAYNEMMLENKENQISLEFISNTVEKIYQSPFESKNLTKAELEVLNKLAEKGLEKIETVKKIIE